MSTRQLRLNSQEQILKRIGEFTGKKINIVLNDNTVVLAQLVSVDSLKLHVVNMRLKHTSIPLADITEIYFDTHE